MDWLKRLLEAQGLTTEQIEAITEGAETELKNYIPKHRFDEINVAKKQLETDIKDRDTQLNELKKNAGNNEELKKQIEQLQQENKTKDEQYQTQLKETQLNGALKLALNGKVHDADLVAGLIDKTKIELGEDGNISKGLDDQIKTLKESKSFLFVTETNSLGIKGVPPSNGDPNLGGGNQPNFGDKVADFAKSNGDLEKVRSSYFQ